MFGRFMPREGRFFELFNLHAHETVEGSGCDDEMVIRQAAAVSQQHLAARCVQPGHFGHQNSDIGLIAEHMANRLGNGRRCQTGRSHLVQERLKQVVVLPVDDSDIHLGMPQSACCLQAAEAAANDQDPGPW